MGPSAILGAIGVMGLGIAMFVSLRIIYGLRPPLADPIYQIIRIIGIVLIVLSWFAILFLTGFVLGLLIFAISIVTACMVWRQLVLLRRRTHMALIAMAVEKQIPLPACIRAYADEEGGFFASNATDFAEQLQSGVPLTAAIAESTAVLPRFAELAARVGMACDRLAPALRQELTSDSDYAPIRRSIASRTLYLCVALSFVPLILSFMMIKIVPAFIRIFNDFEVELPTMTVVLISVSSVLVNFAWIAVLLCFLGMIATVYAAIWYMGFRLPLPFPLSSLAMRFDRATVERALAFPAEQSRPLDRMIDLLAMYHPQGSVRSRLSRASDRIETGQNWIDSLRKESLLGRADVAVLRAAERVGNLSWALREMAASNERRLIHRLEALVQILSVITIFAFGCVVAFIVISCFIPLVKLIEALT
jgi:general secretion pathway protein F